MLYLQSCVINSNCVCQMFLFTQRTVRTVKGNLMLYPFDMNLKVHVFLHILASVIFLCDYFCYCVMPC